METTVKNENKVIARLRQLGISPLMCVIFIALALVPLFVKDEFLLRLLVSSLMFGGLAMAFDFTSGFINIVNFGFFAFTGLGAYTSGLVALKLGVSPWLGILAAVLMTGFVGFCLGLLTIRLGGIFAACMAWFVALALMAITSNWVDLTRGNSGLNVPPLFDTYRNLPYYYVILAMVVLIYVLVTVISKSKIGLAFRAIGQDPVAAASSGVFATKYKVLNFTISCCLAGLIGGFYAHYIGVLTPQVMHTRNTVEVMVISYVGGRGTIWGGLIAAAIIIPVMEYLKSLMEVRLILYGAAMILIMIFYPKGLAGLWEAAINLWQKRRGEIKGKEQEKASI